MLRGGVIAFFRALSANRATTSWRRFIVKLRLTDPSEVAEVDSYFNGFHDGFVKDLRLRSHDLFVREEDGPFGIAHQLTGRFDLELNIAHYNYALGTQPHDRVVHCIFRNITDFRLDLTGRRAEEWPIKVVEFVPAAGRFVLVILWGLFDGQSWGTQRSEICTFEEAELEER